MSDLISGIFGLFKKTSINVPENHKIVKLSPGDLVMNEFCGVSTVTYYNGQLPVDFLAQRTKEIIQLNPWLSSRLVNNSGSVVAVYSDKFDGYFQTAHVAQLDRNSNFQQSSLLLKEYQVKKGKECVDKDEQLFKVTAISTDTNDSMLVFSLSHTLGDGYTFYKIYSMLENGPFPMLIERIEDFPDRNKALLGEGLFQFLTSPGFIIGVIANLFIQGPSIAVKEIDPKFIATEKEKAKKDTDFVSTNDIVTAKFLSMCQSSYGMMAINMRNRVKGITDLHAGNYEGSLILLPEYTPEGVRKALKTLKMTDPFPTFWQSCFGNNAAVSNWASFHHDLKLPGNMTPLNHHPLERDTVHMVYSTGIIYKPCRNKISLLFGDVNPNRGRDMFLE